MRFISTKPARSVKKTSTLRAHRYTAKGKTAVQSSCISSNNTSDKRGCFKFHIFFLALINQDEFWIAVGTNFRPNLDGVIFSFRFCFVIVIQFFYDTRERLLSYFNWGIYCYGWELTTVMTNKLNTIYEYPRGTSMQLLSQSVPRCYRTVTKMARAVEVTSFVRR